MVFGLWFGLDAMSSRVALFYRLVLVCRVSMQLTFLGVMFPGVMLFGLLSVCLSPFPSMVFTFQNEKLKSFGQYPASFDFD